jgi:oxygen-independent coproporphyrinogen-3 oxidase
MNPKGIYLHVPFCAKKCAYCDFYSRGASPALVDEYVIALIEQINLSKTDNTPVGSIYFGGGTPSMLTEKQLGRIFSALEKYNLPPDAEITIECNPEDFTQDFAKGVKAIGFNRISLGVQSFDKNELISIGRSHTPETAEKSVVIAKNHFDNVSLDLMLGTPAQTEGSLEASLSKCNTLQPDHVSAYLMKVYENTVFGKKGVAEASEELSESLYIKASDFLRGIGYEHYEISSFSFNGKYSRHNMLYWTGGEYIAFGAGACGYENGIRYRYPGNAEAFAAKRGRATFIIEEEETTSSLKEEALIFGLRTSKGILIDGLTKESIEYSNMLCKNGFAETANNIFRLTPKGWLISNEIITEVLIRESADS